MKHWGLGEDCPCSIMNMLQNILEDIRGCDYGMAERNIEHLMKCILDGKQIKPGDLSDEQRQQCGE